MNDLSFEKAVDGYYSNLDSEKCCRYAKAENEWANCYAAFGNSNITDEELVKYLDDYLHSWGMYRNSFIHNHKDVHFPAIKIIRSNDYMGLRDLSCRAIIHNKDTIEKLIKAISNAYYGQRRIIRKRDISSPISPVLVSKVLLGTLGCVPAYDSRLPRGLKELGIRPITFGINSVISVAKAFEEYESEISALANRYPEEYGVKIPTMKIIDSGLWYLGKG